EDYSRPGVWTGGRLGAGGGGCRRRRHPRPHPRTGADAYLGRPPGAVVPTGVLRLLRPGHGGTDPALHVHLLRRGAVPALRRGPVVPRRDGDRRGTGVRGRPAPGAREGRGAPGGPTRRGGGRPPASTGLAVGGKPAPGPGGAVLGGQLRRGADLHP